MSKKGIACFETDASRMVGKAEKVIFPKDYKEVQSIIKISKNIVPRGGGTGRVGGAIPNNSVVVDLSKMFKILDFDKNRDLVTVEAGITIRELNEKLEVLGYEFPITSFNNASTIGGMIATNSTGSRGMKYGNMKDWIEEVDFVNGRGDLIKTGKTDLSDVCGMEGITGIIVRAKLKTVVKVKRSISLFQTPSLEKIISISRRLKSEKEVVSLTLLPKLVSRVLKLRDVYNLIVEFDSERGKIKDEEYEKIIDLKNKAVCLLMERGYYNVDDYKFFFDKLNQVLLYLDSNEIPYFSYVGTSAIYPFFRDDEKNKQAELMKIIKKIGGKFGRFGVGIKRKEFLEEFDKKIIHRIKLRHDPFGKMNPGKVIDFEPKISTGKHLAPLQEDEIEEIRPLLQEDGKSLEVAKIDEENREEKMKNEKSGFLFKTPEEKMEEFIGEVKKTEEKIPAKIERKDAREKTSEEVKEEYRQKIGQQIKDYEQTFESEFRKDRKEKIEEFARNVPKEIVNKTPAEEPDTGKRTKEEKNLIDNIMFNKKSKDEDKDER